MKKLIAAIITAAVLAVGGVTLHADNTVASVPVSIDCQSHWQAPGNPSMQHLHVGAVDMDLTKIVTGVFNEKIRTQLYHTDAVPFAFSVLGPGRFPSEINRVFDTTGGYGMGIVGNLNGVVVANAVSTQDPNLWHPDAKHGPDQPLEFSASARMSNNDELRATLVVPVNTAVDTTLPVHQGAPLECWGWSHSGRTPAEIGSLLITFAEGDRQVPTAISHWPTAPITQLTTVRVQAGRYGPADIGGYLTGEGYFEQRNNPDLHNGNEGLLVQRIPKDFSQDGNVSMDVILDPAQLHEGVNRILLRISLNIVKAGPFPGDEVAQTLLTLTVVKGDPNAPPPLPTDTDGDGVADGVDQCPSQFGPAPTGCPPVEPPPPPPANLAPLKADLAQAVVDAQVLTEPLRSQVLAAIAAILVLIGG